MTTPTPFISFLPPTRLDEYNRNLRPDEQTSTNVPSTFVDAMDVRHAVYVEEQHVPLKDEFDDDDHLSCHWVIYASVNKTEQAEVLAADGTVLQPRRSSTRSLPIGTIRLIPFPHLPHPRDGERYVNMKLVETLSADGTVTAASPPPTAEHRYEIRRPFGADRPTSLHDGIEPYVRLSRLAVIKEFRGHRISRLLIKAALAWMREHPAHFNPSVKELGLEQIGATNETQIPQWRGLVCVHAQIPAIELWEKWGFKLDDKMGTWHEDGIPHRGMFLRLDVEPGIIRI